MALSPSSDAKSRIDRILRLQEQIDAIKNDIRSIYADEKADGGDKTAMGVAVSAIRKRAKDKDAFDEREEITTIYLAAYYGLRAHAYARPDEPLPSEPAAQEGGVAEATQLSSSGRTEPSADGQSIPPQPLAAGLPEAPALGEQGLAGPACVYDDGTANIKPAPIQPETATEPGTEAAGTPAIAEDASRQERAAGANSTVLSLRPHCLHPDCCGSGGGKSHCFSCRKAAWLNGEEAA